MPIKVLNRYTGNLELEEVSHENWINWMYNTPIGRSFLYVFFRKALFSKVIGRKMRLKSSKKFIKPFSDKFNINLDDFLKNLDDYQNFNDFFTRQFKPEKRIFDENPNKISFSADGRHLGFEHVNATSDFFIKGEKLNIEKLLPKDQLYYFDHGPIVISRLCPADYHRFHFPINCIPSAPKLINGFLYSVNPIALAKNCKIFTENKRVITLLNTNNCGKIIMIEIGATCVGSISQTFSPNIQVTKGQEKGFFNFGGSTIITIFQQNKVLLAKDLLDSSANNVELLANCGDTCAIIKDC